MNLSNPALAEPLTELAQYVWTWALVAATFAMLIASIRDEFPTWGPAAWVRNVFTALCVVAFLLRAWAGLVSL